MNCRSDYKSICLRLTCNIFLCIQIRDIHEVSNESHSHSYWKHRPLENLTPSAVVGNPDRMGMAALNADSDDTQWPRCDTGSPHHVGTPQGRLGGDGVSAASAHGRPPSRARSQAAAAVSTPVPSRRRRRLVPGHKPPPPSRPR